MKFKIIPTLVYLCLLPTLIALGMWQLDRSEQKRAFLKVQERAVATETLHLSTAIERNTETLRYRNAEVTGRYDVAHQFLIDNQISDGKAGYFVLTPFILTGETKAVLVNRGWIPLNQDRSILPDLQINKAETIITGRINNFPSVGIKLAGAEIPTEGWPAVVQVVNNEVLAKKLGYPLFQFQIELAKELPDGFKREWHTSTIMQPEQHTAYAVQWFALALTLTILFIGISFKKNDAKSKNKNHILILVIFGMSVIPFLIAWGLKEHPQLLKGQTNHGQLITPPLTTERGDLTGFDQFSTDNMSELTGHWLLVNVIPNGDCNERCIEAIHKTKQLRLMLNKELTRTRRIVMVLKDVAPEIAGKWWEDDKTLLRVKPNDAVARKIAAIRQGNIPDGMLLLMDPLGNLMMQYEPGFDPYNVKSDLMHLLRISQIG